MTIRFGKLLLVAVLLTQGSFAQAERIKDLAVVHGVRSNQLFGYGLVVGLKGTGDNLMSRFTLQSLAAMLGRMGVRVDPKEMRVRNIAAVIVTADLPPFFRTGGRIDVLVSSIGSARSLQGGNLLFTPLKGADGKVYAVAQGPVSVGGYQVQSGSASLSKNHTTSGRIPQGASVEREVKFELKDRESLQLNLVSPDFTTAARMVEAINKSLGADQALAIDPGTIQLTVPDEFKGKTVGLIAKIEGLDMQPDGRARVVVNERTGTVVMGDRVRVSRVAISHGSLHLEVRPRMAVSQPGALSGGKTVASKEDQLLAREEPGGMRVVEQGTSLGEVVRALNTIGATPRDLIEILQAIRAAGALPATLEIL